MCLYNGEMDEFTALVLDEAIKSPLGSPSDLVTIQDVHNNDKYGHGCYVNIIAVLSAVLLCCDFDVGEIVNCCMLCLNTDVWCGEYDHQGRQAVPTFGVEDYGPDSQVHQPPHLGSSLTEALISLEVF